MLDERTYDASDFSLDEKTMPTLRWLGDQMPGGFFIYRADESQEMLYANRATLRIFGCETADEFKEFTGNTFAGLVHPEDYERAEDIIKDQIGADESGNLDHVGYRIIRKDGEVRQIDDFGHLAQLPGYGDVYFVFISDVTEKYNIEQEKLREMSERMRVEMELERERHANEVKSSFLFNISHDIRTPMNAIIGFSDLARRHMTEPDRLADCLDKVDESSSQLLALIDDLLEMSRIDYGRIEIKAQPANIVEQIDMVLDLFRPQADEKGIALVEEIDLPDGEVLVDDHRFRRVLGNLVSNAVKFTPGGGKVTVSARQKQASDSGYVRYQFSVADTGVGMTEDFMQRMYDAFERETSSTKAGVTGTGLGLSITKSLLDMMGGSISVTSKKGEGSTFTVDLPLKLVDGAAATEAEPVQEVDQKAEGEYRVLLVEDIEINRMLAEAVLEEADFLVESVPDGCDAVEAVANHPLYYYDLVLMDIQMPVMNGYEATRSIRALNRADTADLPIIALSANAREEDKRMSIESGMNSHVAKPFDVAHLISTVNAHIAARNIT